jgi:CubicO group peptidase (beta-lactamase class C family)
VTRITRRRIALAALAVVVSAGLLYLTRVASILAAYKAKMLCSEVLLAHRDPRVVTTELEVDDLAPLRIINASVDASTRTATASVAGLFTHRAAYEDGRGCVLLYEPRVAREALRAREEEGASGIPVLAPIDHALDSLVNRAFSEPDPLRPRRTRAVVILRNGEIVAERYAYGFGADTPLLGWSMAKTVTNALVGILVKEGRLSVESPAAIPEWQSEADPRRRITLDHLLRMSSGLQFNESAANPVSDVTVMLLGSPSAGLYAARKKLASPPGTVWQYSSGTTNIVSYLIRRVINNDADYLAFPRTALFDRIGLTHALIEMDSEGLGSSRLRARRVAGDWRPRAMNAAWHQKHPMPKGATSSAQNWSAEKNASSERMPRGDLWKLSSSLQSQHTHARTDGRRSRSDSRCSSVSDSSPGSRSRTLLGEDRLPSTRGGRVGCSCTSAAA